MAQTTAAVHVFLVSTFLVGAALFLAGVASGADWMALLSKPLPVLALAIWAARDAPHTVGRLVVAGLILGVTGDILLELGDATFLPGLGAFLLGHVVYAVAFSLGARRLGAVQAIPLLGYVLALSVLLVPALGDFSVPVIAYMGAIAVMAWRAAVFAQERAGWAWAVLVGAVLFMFSDTLIALNRFVSALSGIDPAIILTYWAGQAALTAGVVLSDPAPEEAPVSPAA